MIKKIIIILNNDEFYDDAQLLARSFFVRAEIERIKKDDKKEDVFKPVKTVEISSDGETCTLNLNAIVPSAGIDQLTRGQVHDLFKRAMYKDISASTGKTLPWGFLTGVKPAKRITEIMKKNPEADESAVRKKFEIMYMVRPDKSRLAYEVAENEEKIMGKRLKDKGFSIYVGIPFCPSVCDYCSFGSVPVDSCGQDKVEEYLEALFNEIKKTGELIRDKYDKASCVYIGGGTPTTLSPEQTGRLLSCISDNFVLGHDVEYTFEAGRPDSISKEKLEVLKKHGVNRISINPQSMNEVTLQRIGRSHSEDDVFKAFEVVRSIGFDNINTDIILALPGEGPAEVGRTAEKIRQLAPDSLTVHSLAIKRAAAMTRSMLPEDLTEEDTERMVRCITDLANDLEMKPYYMYRQQNMAGNLENVGYAREGKESLYNVVIMEEVQDIIALGAGASSKFIYKDGRIERAINVKSINDYISRNDEMIERKRRLL